MSSITSSSPLQASARLLQTQLQMSATRWLFLAFVALMIGAAGIRLLTADRYLPYMDYHDESFIYILARDWRGVEQNTFIAERLSGYPPLYIWIHGAIQSAFESLSRRPWYTPPDYIHILRLVAVVTGIGTTLFITAIGWQLGGAIAGLFAGLLWAFAPIVVDNNTLAVADPFGYLACAGATAMALRAWKQNSLLWLFGCLLAGIASLYIKYWTLYPFFLWGIIALRIFWKQGRRALPGLGLQIVVGAAAAAGLLRYLSTAGLSRLSPEMTNFSDQGVGNALGIGRNLNNLSYFPLPIGPALFWIVMLLGVVAFMVSWRKKWPLIDEQLVILLGITAFVAVIPTSTFIYISSTKYIRHALPVTLLLMGIWGAAVAQLIWTIRKFAQERSTFRYAASGAGLLVLSVTLIPYLFEDMRMVQDFGRTDLKQILWEWADVNVPLEGLILMDRRSLVEDTWNRPWSGYDGSKTFEWWFDDADTLVRTPPEAYAERGMTYFAMSEMDRIRIYEPDDIDIDSFLSQLTLVKIIPAAPDRVGESLSFYRLLPPQFSAGFDFGGQIKLDGYDISATTLKPGETILFRPYWRIDQRPTTNYSMFVHFYPEAEDQLLAQYDGAPTIPERPTLTWDDVNELYIGADVPLALPADLPAGNYRLALGLYDYNTGTRLAGSDGSTYFSIPVSVAE